MTLVYDPATFALAGAVLLVGAMYTQAHYISFGPDPEKEGPKLTEWVLAVAIGLGYVAGTALTVYGLMPVVNIIFGR